MSELKHTPGPWRVGETEEKLNYLQKPIWSDDHRAVVAYAVGTTNPMLDWFAGACNYHINARLIAAAPKMVDYIKRKADAGCAEAQQILREATNTEGGSND